MKSKNKKRDEKKQDYNIDAQKGWDEEEMKKKKPARNEKVKQKQQNLSWRDMEKEQVGRGGATEQKKPAKINYKHNRDTYLKTGMFGK